MSVYKKYVSVGSFAKKGEDIKDGDIIKIASEGKKLEGDYGERDVFLVKLANGEEKNVGVNQTTINNLVEAYGEESRIWIGKEAKVWLIKMMVSGKMVTVLFLSHPDATMDDDGRFVLPAGFGAF